MVLPTELPDSLLGRPFTVTQARLAGVNENVLRGARFTRLFRDVYVEATLPVDTRLRASGLRLVLPRRSAFCRHTAAELYGLPLKDDVLHVWVADPSSRPRHREGVRIHEAVRLEDIRLHNGLPLTTPERTYLDLASVLDLVTLVLVGDAMLRTALTTLDSLRMAVAPVRRRRGVVLARAALAYLRERVDSPMETRLRMLLVLAGLPCPVPTSTSSTSPGSGSPDRTSPTRSSRSP